MNTRHLEPSLEPPESAKSTTPPPADTCNQPGPAEVKAPRLRKAESLTHSNPAIAGKGRDRGRNYQPAAIPGLLQTPAYARRLLSSGPRGVPADLGERVVGRIERQRLLYNEAHRFRFVIPEAVLRWPYGPAGDPAVIDEHREQLARVEMVMGRPNVEVGVLPLAPVWVWRTAGFVIFDEVEDGEPLVHLEWLTRPYNIIEPDQVEMCRQAFSNLLGASVTGAQARELVILATEEIRPQ